MRLNRKIILGIVLLLILSVLGGCKSKPPEGVGQEFYDDMVSASKELIKIIRNAKEIDVLDNDFFKSKSYVKIYEYDKYKYDFLTLIEQNILDTIDDLYLTSILYHNAIQNNKGTVSYYEKDIIKLTKTFSNLMEIELDVNKILLK